MSTGPRNQVIFDRNKILKERIFDLENAYTSLVDSVSNERKQEQEQKTQIVLAVDEALKRLSMADGRISEVIEAVIRSLGSDFKAKVDQSIQDIKKENQTKFVEDQEKELKQLIADKKVEEKDKVTDKSLLVLREYNQDGTVKHPGRFQVTVENIAKELRANFLDKAIGDVIETKANTKLEILGIYEETVPVAPESDENKGNVDGSSQTS